MTNRDPWWQRVDEAAQLITSTVNAAAARAGRDGTYAPPPGSPPPRRRRRPASLRHLAEVIRTHRMAPGAAVDKDIVGGVLAGDLRHLSDPVTVVAVARASHHIAGAPFTDTDAQRLTVAVERLNTLIETAQETDTRAPDLLPVPRRASALARTDTPTPPPNPPSQELRIVHTEGGRRRLRPILGAALAVLLLATAGAMALWRNTHDDPPATAGDAEAPCHEGTTTGEIIPDAATVFDDDQATRLSPTLDFDAMNGSARYATHAGRTYYWGRAGSDDDKPHSGGTRVRWKIADGPWHSCEKPLPQAERGYVHSPAVPTTIGGQAVTIQVCLWRDTPERENCTIEIATG